MTIVSNFNATFVTSYVLIVSDLVCVVSTSMESQKFTYSFNAFAFNSTSNSYISLRMKKGIKRLYVNFDSMPVRTTLAKFETIIT